MYIVIKSYINNIPTEELVDSAKTEAQLIALMEDNNIEEFNGSNPEAESYQNIYGTFIICLNGRKFSDLGKKKELVKIENENREVVREATDLHRLDWEIPNAEWDRTKVYSENVETLVEKFEVFNKVVLEDDALEEFIFSALYYDDGK